MELSIVRDGGERKGILGEKFYALPNQWFNFYRSLLD